MSVLKIKVTSVATFVFALSAAIPSTGEATAASNAIAAALETVNLPASQEVLVKRASPCSNEMLRHTAEVISSATFPSIIDASRQAEQIIACGWSNDSKARNTLQAGLSVRKFGSEPATLILERATGLLSDAAYVSAAGLQIRKSIPSGPFDITLIAVPLDYAIGACLPMPNRECVSRFLSATLPASLKLDPASVLAFYGLFPARNLPLLEQPVEEKALADNVEIVVSSGFPVDPRFLKDVPEPRHRLLEKQSDAFFINRYNVNEP